MSRALVALVALVAAGCSDPSPPSSGPPIAPGPSRRLTDVFPASGLRLDSPSIWPNAEFGPVNAAAVADCDADGRPDAFTFTWGAVGTLWRNVGSVGAIRFEPLPPPPGLDGLTPSAAAFGDLDNDGLPDLILSIGVEEYLRSQRGGAPPFQQEIRVYRNQGGCRFEDVSAAWGFAPWRSDHGSMFAGVDLADVNLDGRLDMVTRRVLDPDAPVLLFLSRPDGTWAEAMNEVFGQAPGGNWSNLFTDVDDDGLADLFLLFDQHIGPPARYLHRVSASASRPYVEETFDPRYFAPEYNPAALMGGASGDVDGDGRLDLYFLDIGPQHLYTHRSGRRDVAAEAGVDIPMLMPSEAPTVAFGLSLADYDNDTWPDLAVAVGVTDGFKTPPAAVLRHNRGDGTFEDATALLDQPSTFTSLWMTASDLDRDGRVDYWMGGFAGPPRVLRNEVGAGRSLAVRLRGRTSNAEGVGAKVTARVGSRVLVQEMQSGGMGWGYGEHRLVFGLGAATGADSLEVRWPDGYVQRTGRVAAGTVAVIEEPDLLRVEPRVLAPGGDARIVVRPARPTGEPLGAGHRVEVVMDPGDVALAVTDVGDGSYTATARALPAGLHGFTVRIDGAALFAHPQVIAR